MKQRRLNLSQDEWLFFWGLSLVTIIRIYLIFIFPLTGDEAYHWEWSRHLAWGYYDHPPLVAWLIALWTAIGGSTIFWTRLTALLCASGATYLTYRMGREVGGERVGVVAGLFSLTALIVLLGGVIVTTDLPLLFFWQATAYLAWLAVKHQKGRYWYWAGVTLGLGMLSKFLIFPLVIGLLVFLIASPADRFWLRRREPYMGLAIALMIFAPFVIWNSQHGWTTFAFQFTRHTARIDLLRPLAYLAGESLIVGPLLYGGMLWSFYRLIRRTFSGSATEQRIAWFMLGVGWLMPVFFFLDSARNEFSVHWPAAALGVAFIGLAWELARKRDAAGVQNGNRPIGQWFWGSSALYTGAVLVVLVLVVFQVVNPGVVLGSQVLGRNTGEIYGWEKIGQKVSQIHRQFGSTVPITTSSYTFSSMLSFYTPDHIYLGVVGPGSKHGRAYDLWDNWPAWQGGEIIFISTDDPDDPASKSHRILQESCTSFQVLEGIRIRYHTRIVRDLYATIGFDVKPDPYRAIRRSYRW